MKHYTAPLQTKDIPNILAMRYASSTMRNIWSESGKILSERELWIAVMKAQRELGLSIPLEAIQAYEAVKEQIDLSSIRARDRKLRHDVKARIEEFCALAGYEHIHKGLTSRDLTDNVEQLQIVKSLKYLRIKAIAALAAIALHALEFQDLVLAARTHNVVAQPTTLGKRFAMFGQELLIALERLDQLIERYPLRGLKGAVGTLLDQKTLFADDSKKVDRLQKSLLKHLGFKNLLNAVGQVYPRSMDFDVVTALHQLGSGPSSFCKTLRLMAGQGLFSEGFQKDQVGSSSMPHKMNSRNCERVNGLQVILSGYVTMTSFLSGDQWNEGDVSCSVVRRVVLPDSFFAMDGLFETFLTILQEMKVFPERIRLEVDQVTPFLSSTTLLMKAVQKGIGREEAHQLLKKHSTNVMEDLLKGRIERNDLVSRLGQDERFPFSEKEIIAILADPKNFIGEATSQVQEFSKNVEDWIRKFPDSKGLQPEPLV